MDSIKRHNPEWTHKLWTLRDLNHENFPRTFPYIQKILAMMMVSNGNRYSSISDLMRFEYLYHHGGLHLDSNFEAFRPFDELMSAPINVAHESNYHNSREHLQSGQTSLPLSNSLIGAVPHHPALTIATSNEWLSKINLGDPRINVSTGPYYWGKAFQEFVRTHDTENPHYAFRWIDTGIVYPIDWYETNPCIVDLQPDSDDDAGEYVPIQQGHAKGKFLRHPCGAYDPPAIMMNHWLGRTWYGLKQESVPANFEILAAGKISSDLL